MARDPGRPATPFGLQMAAQDDRVAAAAENVHRDRHSSVAATIKQVRSSTDLRGRRATFGQTLGLQSLIPPLLHHHILRDSSTSDKVMEASAKAPKMPNPATIGTTLMSKRNPTAPAITVLSAVVSDAITPEASPAT